MKNNQLMYPFLPARLILLCCALLLHAWAFAKGEQDYAYMLVHEPGRLGVLIEQQVLSGPYPVFASICASKGYSSPASLSRFIASEINALSADQRLDVLHRLTYYLKSETRQEQIVLALAALVVPPYCRDASLAEHLLQLPDGQDRMLAVVNAQDYVKSIEGRWCGIPGDLWVFPDLIVFGGRAFRFDASLETVEFEDDSWQQALVIDYADSPPGQFRLALFPQSDLLYQYHVSPDSATVRRSKCEMVDARFEMVLPDSVDTRF